MTISVFVGGRADLGPLTPVLRGLVHLGGEVEVLTAVGFDERSLESELAGLGVDGVAVRAVGPVLAGDDAEALAGCGAAVSVGVSAALRSGVRALVVLGDRWELPWVVMPAVLRGVPVVHVHGGEVTEGAIDERVRHAVTKLADVHCVASEDARDRLLQLGECASSVHLTGAPGLDRIVGATPMTDGALAQLLGVEVRRPLALFTYHAVTTEAVADVVDHAVAALRATADAAGTVVVTHPGPDSGGLAVREALVATAATLPDVVVVPGLGAHYPAVLAACDVVVGNSSSGVIEAASVARPAIDVGSRQRGRLAGHNVRHVDDGYPSVRAGLEDVLAAPPGTWTGVPNPYGDGASGDRIAGVVSAVVGPAGPKRFVDRPERGLP